MRKPRTFYDNTPTMQSLGIIILAAGLGKRMRSDIPKVLHKTCDMELIHHVLHTTQKLSPLETILVVGHKKELVKDSVLKVFPSVNFAVQETQLGTGHAVQCALSSVQSSKNILILYGDTPLTTEKTLKEFLAFHEKSNSDVSLITVVSEGENAFGRIIRDPNTNNIVKIQEAKDCSPAELTIKEVNSGIYVVSLDFLIDSLSKLKNSNAQKEYYLTDIVEIAVSLEKKVGAFTIRSFEEVQGVNTLLDLAMVNKAIQTKRIEEFITNGVSFRSPESVFIEKDVQIASGVSIGPSVELLGATVIEEGVVIEGSAYIKDSLIGKNVHLKLGVRIEGTKIEEGVSVGPFAHLRPETVLEKDVRIGNFVETKKAHLKQGAKANHLTYLGDCSVGTNANVGAGTITCNYDGYVKSKTTIGDNVFIGSNTALVAPVEIKAGATVGAGSVITKTVEADALAFTRSPLTIKQGWAKSKREKAKKK